MIIKDSHLVCVESVQDYPQSEVNDLFLYSGVRFVK